MFTCKVCNASKEAEEFPVASITKTGRAGECKQCKSTRVKLMREERSKILFDMFNGECTDCKLTHPNTSFFDFHHTNTKKKTREVKQILCGAWATLLKELESCVMLCPNCHRERHLKEGWK